MAKKKHADEADDKAMLAEMFAKKGGKKKSKKSKKKSGKDGSAPFEKKTTKRAKK